jgi:thiamine-phosphate diphosphorylase
MLVAKRSRIRFDTRDDRMTRDEKMEKPEMIVRVPGRAFLHVITDPRLGGHGHRSIARAAFAAGADVVQLRDKTAAPGDLVELARELQELARTWGRLLVVNDHVEVARAAGAGGLHLGPDDRPLEEARRLWPRPLILGGSARTVERARRLEEAGADYLGVGPVFGTSTKADAPNAIGLDRLFEVASAVAVPVIAIGGIDASNAARAIAAGARGVAVVSAVAGARDPESAVISIRRALDAPRDQRIE